MNEVQLYGLKWADFSHAAAAANTDINDFFSKPEETLTK